MILLVQVNLKILVKNNTAFTILITAKAVLFLTKIDKSAVFTKLNLKMNNDIIDRENQRLKVAALTNYW